MVPAFASLPLLSGDNMSVEMESPDTTKPSEEITLPSELDNLAKLVSEKPEALATGSEDLRKAALDATRFIYNLGMVAYTLQ